MRMSFCSRSTIHPSLVTEMLDPPRVPPLGKGFRMPFANSSLSLYIDWIAEPSGPISLYSIVCVNVILPDPRATRFPISLVEEALPEAAFCLHAVSRETRSREGMMDCGFKALLKLWLA